MPIASLIVTAHGCRSVLESKSLTALSSQDKNQIIRELGITEFLLPKLISEALTANNEVKYRLSLLQAAKRRADFPAEQFSNLHNERLLSGIQDENLDKVVENSKKLADGRYEVGSISLVFQDIINNVEQMIEPLRAAGKDYEQAQAEFSRRLADLVAGAKMENETVDGQFLSMLTSADKEKRDSIHLLVVDLHKVINALQGKFYPEAVEGAKTYGLQDRDRELVRVFMNGVNQTAQLKFNHPGLETTATRNGNTLLIENNIGVTETHIIVLSITGRKVSTTYSDIHLQRVFFFQSFFENFAVTWQETTAKKGTEALDSATYHSTVGIFEAENDTMLKEYLAFLGSRIVFLIDWNRARKQLKEFLNNKDAVQVLKWAADNNFGHCGFLQLGGSQLVYGAIEQGARGIPLRYGVKLEEILGKEKASEFFRYCLKTCSSGLLQKRSEFLIKDEIRVELTKYFHSLAEDLLGIAADHATLVIEIARAVRDGLVQLHTGQYDLLKTGADRAKRWETEADELLTKARLILKRTHATSAFEAIISNSDDAADSLEQAVFFLTIISEDQLLEDYESIVALAECAYSCSTDFLKAVENAKTIQKSGSGNDAEEFLQAVDAVLSSEHTADDELRTFSAALFKKSTNFRQLHALSEISERLERSTDSLMRAVMILKDYVLGEMTAS